MWLFYWQPDKGIKSKKRIAMPCAQLNEITEYRYLNVEALMKKLLLIMSPGAGCGHCRIDGSYCGGWRGREHHNEGHNAYDEINHLQDEKD